MSAGRGGVGGRPGPRRGADLGRGRGAERRRLGARAVRPDAGRDRRAPGRSRTWRGCTRSCGGRASRWSCCTSSISPRIRPATATRRSAARYRAWRARQRLSMRQVHTAGEKAFVDYAGQRPTIVDAATGEVIAVELFVAVLGASNYTFAEATRTQQSADWIASHVRAVEYFGGVPAVWVPDQLRTGVTRAVPLRAGRPADLRRVGAALSARSSSRRARRSRATRRRSKSPSRSPSAGSWRGCATRPSSAWPR